MTSICQGNFRDKVRGHSSDRSSWNISIAPSEEVAFSPRTSQSNLDIFTQLYREGVENSPLNFNKYFTSPPFQRNTGELCNQKFSCLGSITYLKLTCGTGKKSYYRRFYTTDESFHSIRSLQRNSYDSNIIDGAVEK